MSNRFIWNDSYSVKVPSLDAQHKNFFRITNNILDLLDKNHTQDLKEQLIFVIAELGKYALEHLGYEEECIKRYNCGKCEHHPEAHEVYRDHVVRFLKEVRDIDTDIYALAAEVATFSQAWLATHIANMDKAYVDDMVKHNAQ